MATTRRLAAILAADVAGYSRLMGEDEEGTLARLKAVRRELADPKIKEHHGRIVKTTGDGLLLEFASVVDAVRCAVEVQRELAERNTSPPGPAPDQEEIGGSVAQTTQRCVRYSSKRFCLRAHVSLRFLSDSRPAISINVLAVPASSMHCFSGPVNK